MPALSARRPRIVLFACLACYALVMLWLAVRQSVDYFDAYEILNNAHGIAVGTLANYSNQRPLVLPALLAPLFVAQRWIGWLDPVRTLTASHVVITGLCFLFLWAVYQLLRRQFDWPLALAGTGLLAIHPLLISMASVTKEDIPAACFLALGFLYYLRNRFGVSGLWLALAVSTRFNLIPVPVAVIGSYELLSGRLWRDRDLIHKKIVYLVVLPGLVFALLPTVWFPTIGLATAVEAFPRFALDMVSTLRITQGMKVPSSLYYAALWQSFSPPVCLLFLLGVVSAAVRRPKDAGFHALWLGLVFVYSAYLIGAKESRYLFPIFIPFVYFAIEGLSRLFESMTRPATRIAAAVAIAAWPGYLAAHELQRRQDAVFTDNYAYSVSKAAAELAGAHRIGWVGPPYAIAPRDYWFNREDKYTYIFHFASHVVGYYTDRVIDVIPSAREASAGVFDIAQTARLDDGDVLVVNREPTSFTTATLPRHREPLLIERVRVVSTAADGAARINAPDGPYILVRRGSDAAHPGEELRRVEVRGGIVVESEALSAAREAAPGRLLALVGVDVLGSYPLPVR